MRLLISVGTGIVAAFMAFMGVQKFTGPNPVFSYIAEQSGIALFEPGVRMLTGLAEFGAAGLLVAGFFIAIARTFGLLLSLAVLGGAIMFHLSPWLGINAPVAFDEAGEYVRSPMLFMMAVAFFLISGVLAYLDRAQNKAA
jgi:hypothetical protein